MDAPPSFIDRWQLADDRLIATRVPLTPPRADELVVRVAGAALGADPQAEIAGVVVACGESAGEWLGKRVAVPRLLPCGDCDRCRRGQVAACPGRCERFGLASHETVPARFVCSLEEPLWPADEELWRLAALADAVATPYAALARVGLAPNETLVIVGGGARARFAAALAEARGARPLVDAGATPRLAGAKIIEVSGSSDGRRHALSLTAPGCTLALCDAPARSPLASPLPTDWDALVADEMQLHGVVGSHPDLLPELCALVTRGALKLGPSVCCVSLAEAPRAHAAHHAGELAELPILALA